MIDDQYEAPGRSSQQIEELTDAIRGAFGLFDEPFFPAVPFLEFGLDQLVEDMVYDIRSKAFLGGREGAVDPIMRVLYIREDVYDAACQDQPRARFTICHEIGHAVMHIGTLNRALPRQKIVVYRQPEWQANRFAGALLAPRHLITECQSIREVSATFGISLQAARIRAKSLGLAFG